MKNKIISSVCSILLPLIYLFVTVCCICFALYCGAYLLSFGWGWLILGIFIAPITPLIIAVYQLVHGQFDATIYLIILTIIVVISGYLMDLCGKNKN